MPQIHILIVGGGYAGFYAAWKLEKLLGRREAHVTVVDPLPYMTYQPFLPEVAAGTVEPRHAVVSQRRHLRKTTVVTAAVTAIDHANKTATLSPAVGESWTMAYDSIIITAGAVTRTFPIPGVADNAIGLKTIEEASSIRDRMVANFDRAATLAPGRDRDKLLTVVVVGGGFAGIEIIGELRSFASSLIKYYPQLTFDDTHFHLVEATDRIMPEVSLKTSLWVIKNFAQRGIDTHLNTRLTSAVDGAVELSTGEAFDSDMIIWTAGVMAAPMVKHNSDLPVDSRGRIRVRADLRVEGDAGIIEGAWGAGDVAAVPDLTGNGIDGFCVPNAQHAVRQAKLLATNIVSVLRGEGPRDYKHKSEGAVAGIGLGVGVFQSGRLALTGLPAWIAHRGYHGLAIPSFERKFRVFGNWIASFLFLRDIAALDARHDPRGAFESVAARPAAPSATVPSPAARPAAKKALKPAGSKKALPAEPTAEVAAPSDSPRAKK